MGGGNGQKSAKAREKNQAKAKAAAKGSQLKANAAALTIVCNICRQTFMNTTTAAALEVHRDSKHEKKTFKDCFPDQTPP